MDQSHWRYLKFLSGWNFKGPPRCEIPSLKLTWPLKIRLPNRKVVFQPSIFRGYAGFREGISIGYFIWKKNASLCLERKREWFLGGNLCATKIFRKSKHRRIYPWFAAFLAVHHPKIHQSHYITYTQTLDFYKGNPSKLPYTPLKTNMDTQNHGLEKVTPLKNGNYWYQFVRFLGCIRIVWTPPPFRCGLQEVGFLQTIGSSTDDTNATQLCLGFCGFWWDFLRVWKNEKKLR